MASKGLSQARIQQLRQDFLGEPKNRMARNAVTHSDILDVARNREAAPRITHTFSHQVEPLVKASNQKASGRCWLFAALNAMRIPLMKKYKLERFEFSYNYLFFWDKLEKANYFLENIISTRHEDLESRLSMWLLRSPVQDGGQWNMFVNLVKKYGVAPAEAMPESYHSGASARLNWILTYKLREYAMFLREQAEAGSSLQRLRREKEGMLAEVFKILAIHLGEPPLHFDWRFRDSKKRFHAFNQLTPHSFLKRHVPYQVEDKICLINAPSTQRPMKRTYTVDYLGNTVEGEDVCYLNMPIEDLKRYSIRSLKAGEAVWFGCDVGKHFHPDLGVLDPELYDYKLVFDTDFALDKGKRLDYGESCMTHAMLFSGVDLTKQKPEHWKVENSWGPKLGKEGFFSMSDRWFDEYVFQVAVDRRFLPKTVLKLLQQRPIRLAPWDPLGTLA
jgi:bleomycin hydrolase